MDARQASESELRTCPNCRQLFDPNSSYCPHCGQKNVASKIKAKELLQEFVNSLFNIDARIIVTLRDLWKPGALTSAYLSGQRKKYIHPIRLFLFSLLFLLFSFSYSFDNIEGLNTERYFYQIHHAEAQKRIIKSIDSMYREHLHYQASNREILDSFYLDVLHREDYLADSINVIPDTISHHLQTDSTGISFSSIDIDFSISHRDLAYLTTEAIVEKYGTGSFWNDLWIEQFVKAFKNPRGLVFYFIGSITWVYLLLMPIMALFMSLLYIRSNRYFVEHLIFSMHVQTISSLLFGISLFISFGLDQDTYWISSILSYLYFILSLKWYYKQGWLKSLLKIFLISTIYLIALILLALLVIFLRFLLY